MPTNTESGKVSENLPFRIHNAEIDQSLLTRIACAGTLNEEFLVLQILDVQNSCRACPGNPDFAPAAPQIIGYRKPACRCRQHARARHTGSIHNVLRKLKPPVAREVRDA